MVYFASNNIISSLGFSSEENITNIKNNISGVKLANLQSLGPIPAHVSLVDNDLLYSNFNKISDKKEYTRFEKLLILSIYNSLQNSKIDISSSSTLVIISTAKGSIDLLEQEKADLFPKNRIQIYKSADIIQDFFATKNKPVVISNACISGTLALGVAKRLIDAKKYDNIIVAGADIISEFTLSGFLSFKAVGTTVCKPFDKNRDGINLGEGAATIILTSNIEKATKPYIYLTGASSSNDANHISGPSRTGEELAACVINSLKEAGTSSSKVDYISGHGTATPYNDEMEGKAFTISKIETKPVTSVKGFVGHTLGAAGILETIVGLSAIKNNETYPTFGFEELGISSQINVNKKFTNEEVNTVVKTASGFGGCNAAILFSDKLVEEPVFQQKEEKLKILNSVEIINNEIKIGGDTDYISEKNIDFKAFIKSIYKNYDLKYPKFYKMDELSKLAFVATEILLQNKNIHEKYNDYDISVILSNGSSSLNTDAKYQISINDKENYFPSPSIFVYTLANVMAGEICIKNKIKGENTIFVSEKFDSEFMHDYVNILFSTEKTKLAITGRVDFSYPDGKYEAKIFLVGFDNEQNKEFTIKNIK